MSLRDYREVPAQEDTNRGRQEEEEDNEVLSATTGRSHNAVVVASFNVTSGTEPYLIVSSDDDQNGKHGQSSCLVSNDRLPIDGDATDSGDNCITVDDAIERLGTGTFQLVVLTAAGLCFAADAMQVLLLSFLSEVLRFDWTLSDDETASITSMLFFGAIFGTLTLGPLADRIGRKPVFLLAASIISCFGVGVALVSRYWALLANLFMVGWGVGGLTGTFDPYRDSVV
jgi:hypothetical protein